MFPPHWDTAIKSWTTWSFRADPKGNSHLLDTSSASQSLDSSTSITDARWESSNEEKLVRKIKLLPCGNILWKNAKYLLSIALLDQESQFVYNKTSKWHFKMVANISTSVTRPETLLLSLLWCDCCPTGQAFFPSHSAPCPVSFPAALERWQGSTVQSAHNAKSVLCFILQSFMQFSGLTELKSKWKQQ